MNGVMGMIDLVLRPRHRSAADRLAQEEQGLRAASARRPQRPAGYFKDRSRRLALEEDNFSLAQAIDGALHMHAAPARAKGLRLSSEIDPALPDLLCGDAMRLRQILTNFIGNAVKFSGRGEIKVRARSAEQDSHSVLLRIEVSDQGIGISPEARARLFHAFTQADDTSTRKYGGTGLGLIICKRLALLMGGEVGAAARREWAAPSGRLSACNAGRAPCPAGRPRSGPCPR